MDATNRRGLEPYFSVTGNGERPVLPMDERRVRKLPVSEQPGGEVHVVRPMQNRRILLKVMGDGER